VYRLSGTSPSPSLGSPSASNFASSSKRGRQHAEEEVDDDETPKRARADGPSEDAVDVVLRSLRAIMAQEITAVAAEKEAEMAVTSPALWEKIWGSGRLRISNEMCRGKCFSKITREEWPRSVAATRAEILQAFVETCKEQLVLLRQEQATQEAAFLQSLE
jgi:hypothetical protein